jgi:hypothetical protein
MAANATARLKLALNELIDSQGQNLEQALANMTGPEIEVMAGWSAEEWKEAAKGALPFYRWKKLSRLWDTKGEEIKAELMARIAPEQENETEAA